MSFRKTNKNPTLFLPVCKTEVIVVASVICAVKEIVRCIFKLSKIFLCQGFINQ